ncbi:MAG: hypothetical protein QG574_5481 [Cyanobacteriota bacterium erpe_2018_sw_21hr_WHONDRS-SW48-000092_B_bin.40]|nr:hypothetical protein [Cyanobacteriota bacterium erpe_2018_sw_21hr_WHONDRS-SW48-000092_B_bin.40]
MVLTPNRTDKSAMSVVNSFSVIVKNAEPEAFNLGSVTQAPRSAAARDLEAACENLVFEPSDNKIPDLVLAAIKFVMTGYFSDAHQSGLYNRQLRLWETISKIAVVEVQPVTKGFFQKVTLPVYELVFKTVTGKVPIVALVIEPSATASHLELLKDFLAKVAKIQAQSGNQVKGAFVVCDSPFPPAILSFVEKAIGAEDPVARFDSILPPPYQVHINLVVNLHSKFKKDEIQEDISESDSGLVTGRLQLLHPQLRAKKNTEPKDDLNSSAVQISFQ